MKRGPTSSFGSPASAIRPAPGTKPLDWAQATGVVEPVLVAIDRHTRRRRQRRNRRLTFAGGALASLLLAAVLYRSPVSTPASASNEASAALVLEPQRQRLPDGSSLQLRGDATVTVDFGNELRRVVLHRGEAHFEVAKDATRPFLVEASGFGVRALGTAFSVLVSDHVVDVLVTEGRVAVAEAGALTPAAGTTEAAAGEPGRALVDAGQRLVIEVAARIVPQALPVPDDEARNRLAWRVPRFDFTAAPLAEVVALFNQYARGAEPVLITLSDPTLGNLPLSGVLRADNVNVLLHILETSYGLNARRGEAGQVILYRPE
jgi:transmembrane sensor